MNRRNFLKLLIQGTAVTVLPVSSLRALEPSKQIIDCNGCRKDVETKQILRDSGWEETPILRFDYQWLGAGRLKVTREDNANEYIKLEVKTDKISYKMDFAAGMEWMTNLVDIRNTQMMINGKTVDFMELYNREHLYGQPFAILIDVNQLS